jgi:hypothetical protein
VNERGLSERLQEFGCPLTEPTAWTVLNSGFTFVSPRGIGTVASALPCASVRPDPVFPGTCADCELWEAGLTEIATSR